MPGKWSKGKLDPSRAFRLAGSAAGIPVGGPDDRGALRDFAGAVRWRGGAVGAWLVRGTRSCNSGARDHRPRKRKIRRDTVDSGTPVAGELLCPGRPPSVIVGGTS